MDITYPYNVISDLIIESRMIHYNRVMEQPLHKDISPQHFYDTQISVEMDKIKSSLNNIIKKHTKIKPLESVHNIKDIFYRMYLLDNGFKVPDSFANSPTGLYQKKNLERITTLLRPI